MTESPSQFPDDALGLAAGFAAGDFSPVEALEFFLRRIEEHDGRINAFVALSPTAQEEARSSTERHSAGRPLSPLDGVPVAVKDNLAVRGLPATWGSPLYADHVPDEDELPVARLREGGLIVLGKTNVPEFALEGYTGNTLFGITGNPWDTELTPGGSSGGSVAAVAANLVPLAVGTDGGGSIRRPAAYAGLVGLKPSIGRVARRGGLPQVLLDFEVVGPITRTVGDLGCLFQVLAGADPRDHRSLRFVSSGPVVEPGEVRILYVEQFGDAPLDPGIAGAVAAAADRLADLGFRIERGGLPFDVSPVNAFWPKIGQVGLARLMDAEPEIRKLASAKYVELADKGAAVPAREFLRGLEDIWNLRDQASQAFEVIDLIMTPACAAMPWPAAEPWPTVIDGRKVGPRGHAVYTGWVNACGHPAISLPADPVPRACSAGAP